jgi:hypothetical protein
VKQVTPSWRQRTLAVKPDPSPPKSPGGRQPPLKAELMLARTLRAECTNVLFEGTLAEQLREGRLWEAGADRFPPNNFKHF